MGCFLRGKRPLPGNCDNLTEGFEGFPVTLKDCSDFPAISKVLMISVSYDNPFFYVFGVDANLDVMSAGRGKSIKRIRGVSVTIPNLKLNIVQTCIRSFVLHFE